MLWEYLRFFHIVFSLMLVGGIGITLYVELRIHAVQDPKQFAVYLQAGKTAGMVIATSLGLTALFGVLAAWKMGYSLTAGWLVAAYVVTVVAAILPPLTLSRWGQQAGKMMPQAMQAGAVLPEQHALVASGRYRFVTAVMLSLLAFVVVLMVFKPF